MTQVESAAIVSFLTGGGLMAILNFIGNRKGNSVAAEARLSDAAMNIVKNMESEIKRHQNQINDANNEIAKVRSEYNSLMTKYVDVLSQQRDMTMRIENLTKENSELKEKIKICSVNHA